MYGEGHESDPPWCRVTSSVGLVLGGQHGHFPAHPCTMNSDMMPLTKSCFRRKAKSSAGGQGNGRARERCRLSEMPLP